MKYDAGCFIDYFQGGIIFCMLNKKSIFIFVPEYFTKKRFEKMRQNYFKEGYCPVFISKNGLFENVVSHFSWDLLGSMPASCVFMRGECYGYTQWIEDFLVYAQRENKIITPLLFRGESGFLRSFSSKWDDFRNLYHLYADCLRRIKTPPLTLNGLHNLRCVGIACKVLMQMKGVGFHYPPVYTWDHFCSYLEKYDKRSVSLVPQVCIDSVDFLDDFEESAMSQHLLAYIVSLYREIFLTTVYGSEVYYFSTLNVLKECIVRYQLPHKRDFCFFLMKEKNGYKIELCRALDVGEKIFFHSLIVETLHELECFFYLWGIEKIYFESLMTPEYRMFSRSLYLEMCYIDFNQPVLDKYYPYPIFGENQNISGHRKIKILFLGDKKHLKETLFYLVMDKYFEDYYEIEGMVLDSSVPLKNFLIDIERKEIDMICVLFSLNVLWSEFLIYLRYPLILSHENNLFPVLYYRPLTWLVDVGAEIEHLKMLIEHIYKSFCHPLYSELQEDLFQGNVLKNGYDCAFKNEFCGVKKIALKESVQRYQLDVWRNFLYKKA